MATRVTRQFPVTDDHLLSLGEVILDNYRTHKQSFNNFNDVKFHETYDTALSQELQKARNTMSDSFLRKAQATEPGEVKTCKEHLIHSLRILDFHVDSRFESTPDIKMEFRLNNLSRESDNTDHFINFTEDLLGVINKYKTPLLEEGMKEELILSISEQSGALKEQRKEQLATMQNRSEQTTQRVDAMNGLWKHLTTLNKAANLIFAEAPEHAPLFDLPKATTTSKPQPEELPEETA